jgi:hypothetical protein
VKMTWKDTLARMLFPDRCHQWQLGPFGTDWRCLRYKKHDGEHIYEPDCWGDERFENLWRPGERRQSIWPHPRSKRRR